MSIKTLIASETANTPNTISAPITRAIRVNPKLTLPRKKAIIMVIIITKIPKIL
jgi:hypothetical protein